MKKIVCPKCGGTGKIPDPVSQGEYLRNIRNSAGCSMRELAKMIGFSVAYLCDLENGRRRVTDKIIAEYERRLG